MVSTEVTTNGTRDVPCFYCTHHRTEDTFVERPDGGFIHQYSCSKGLEMPTTDQEVGAYQQIIDCPGGDIQVGFQIGGYYSHMKFDQREGAEPNSCIEWQIGSDGEFPRPVADGIDLHLCDFRQLETFVAFWGKELRRRGWVMDEEKSSGEESN